MRYLLLLYLILFSIDIYPNDVKINWHDYSTNTDVVASTYQYGLGDSQYYHDKAKFCIRNNKIRTAIKFINIGMKYCLTQDNYDDLYQLRSRAYLTYGDKHNVFYHYALEDMIKSYNINKLDSTLIRIIKITSSINKTSALDRIEREKNIRLSCIKFQLIRDKYRTHYRLDLNQISNEKLKDDILYKKLITLENEIRQTLRRNEK